MKKTLGIAIATIAALAGAFLAYDRKQKPVELAKRAEPTEEPEEGATKEETTEEQTTEEETPEEEQQA